MLLADYIYTSSIQSFNLVAIGCLQGGKNSDVTRLELVGGVRGETTEDDIIFETKLQDFECLMRSEAVTYQHPWLLVSSLLSLGVEYTLKPL